MTDERNTHIAEEDNGRTLEQIISDAEERRFAAIPSEPMTPERLHAMAAARESAARRRRYKGLGCIAAVVALALIGTLIAVSSLSVDVGADKNGKEEIQTENGVIVKDGGYEAEHDAGDIWRTDDWDAVAAAKTLYPQLMIPEYIPEGYEFELLTIEQLESDDIICEYFFSDKEKEVLEIEIFIIKGGELSTEVDGVSKTLESEKGTVYIQDNGNKIATIQIDDGISVLIWGIISDEQLINIVEHLEI